MIERGTAQAPILLRRSNGRVRWAREMYASVRARSTGRPSPDPPDFTEMTDLHVSRGLYRDVLIFRAGAEQGRAYLWRWGGVQKFYFSW